MSVAHSHRVGGAVKHTRAQQQRQTSGAHQYQSRSGRIGSSGGYAGAFGAAGVGAAAVAEVRGSGRGETMVAAASAAGSSGVSWYGAGVSLGGRIRTSRRCRRAVVARASSARTVAETKSDFLTSYQKPLGVLYSTAINELLVQQHLLRYNAAYSYNSLFGLGVVSVFDQLFGALSTAERERVFDAYVGALCEDPAQYRADASSLIAAAEASKGKLVTPLDSSEASPLKDKLKELLSSGTIGKQHTKFFAIGLFRVLEAAEMPDKAALEALVSDLGCEYDKVTKDLTMYKGMLSKMEGARELMEETVKREQKKDAERLAEKEKKRAEKATAKPPPPTTPPPTATA